MHKAYLSLGSNMGNPVNNLQKAVNILNSDTALTITKVSSIYYTAPVGYTEQDWFYNIALEAETDYTPKELLKSCQKVEQELKRKRIIHWGPRTIDVDIILYDDIELLTADLVIPHPRAHERAFVLTPLYEINANLTIKSQSIAFLIEEISEEQNVKLYANKTISL